MSKITCKCGSILPDNTDRIPYKGYIISDREFFDMLDFVDEMIETDSPCKKELEMTFRRNIGGGDSFIRLKEVYQCPLCGRIMIESTPGQFYFFVPEENDEKNLLDYKGADQKKYTHKNSPKEFSRPLQSPEFPDNRNRSVR